MRQWLCLVCGLIYDEAEGWPSDGIPPGTPWEDVPEDWRCPECGVGKADFEMVELGDDEAMAPATAPAVPARERRPDAPVIIVGSGHAGYSTAAAIREATDRDVMLFTADDGRSYYKPSLSNALARGHSPEALVRENALEVARRLGVRIHTHCPVLGIDRRARAIRTELGVQPYDRLVLAVGAEPIRLPLAGDGAEDVLSVNSLADYERFRARLAGVARVAIIGNGLIGCEFANDLAAAGCAVDVIGLTAWPMDRQLPEAAGRRVQDALGALGVQWHLERTVERVERIDEGYRLTLSDGYVLHADAMLSAVGLRPRTRLAGEAGLEIGIGIRVDEQLRTSDPAIHAIGDCVELDGAPLPYIAPINHAVKALVPSLLGRDTAADYPPLPVAVKTPAHPVVVLTPPPGIDGGWRVSEESGGVRALFEDSRGRLAGFALTGSLVRERQRWVRRCEEDGRADRARVA